MLYEGGEFLCLEQGGADWRRSLHRCMGEFWNSLKVRNTGRWKEHPEWDANVAKRMNVKKKRACFMRGVDASSTKTSRARRLTLPSNPLAGWQQTVESILWIGDFIFLWDTCLLVVYIKYLKIRCIKGLHSILQLCALKAWQRPVVGERCFFSLWP